MKEYYGREESRRVNQNEKTDRGENGKAQSGKEDNYVFIDEKYKTYFDNISDIFEDKVEYILKKHFKKNEPTNKNKLLCLNVCVLWQKRFLVLLSKCLNEFEAYRKRHELKDDEKGENAAEEGGKKQESSEEPDKGSNEHGEDKNQPDGNNQWTEELKSFIKNVKIVDKESIEVVYDVNEVSDDCRPCAQLTSDQIYYLLVESKKRENDLKKNIFTFLKYLPLFIKCIENKSLIEKSILESKLLLNDGHGSNPNEEEVPRSGEVHVNVMNPSQENISPMEIQNKLDEIVHFDCNLSENLETIFKTGIGMVDMTNGKKFCTRGMDTLAGSAQDGNDAAKQTMNGMENHQEEQPQQGAESRDDYFQHNATFNNLADLSKNFFNKKNNNSLILPLSKINDLSLINNISTRSNKDGKEEQSESEGAFYIYKNSMDKLNLYGVDLLINLNNKLIYKVNHIYSLIQFYSMLAKDVFNEG
ncbi:conserved Plasmodium protein, unknown function [Plasmodium knowlesi strain H]|uniref:Uncharacterized protein n=3 Tax=Plasmodium knowlesi TaxID=5850 RepID=A0A5K1V6E6_PLAKH|nr:conserved Plasmodium protein, unknown function [Plasmodium knowlesi strain H]OTN68144.1 Uncharacterized protein PKNOH_S04366000 [Plasmodium knowlesi]CAA9987020.1 conserved Plasmodium protein, unknown function [Plasmodium knowlesi strain H]SBO26689.1 conserved Plasmodium protein, unknown function [Plasmodium knowlesi strain H]SBO28225.1 conserved Plasmodium protein, unknown function [Plasmodium knowlesi strain H]VVS76494.1 conserved Plasmodium protein, unknown function [Plasmodium knowlesi s|eukprot:XP_002258265.1 hypothetical protein, conserved in Plasmodium species [Plasmodium knowlesi strain H]